jgi:hypothetical protein
MRNKLIDIIDSFRELDPPHDGRTWTEHLADHLLSEGVILPPCKVGQTVFFYTCVCDKEGEVKFDIFDGEVISFALQKEGLLAYCHYKCGLTYWHLVKKDFGKTVFLTREEAEKALERSENGK